MAPNNLVSSVWDDTSKQQKLELDRKRELDQKHKWALGEAILTPGRPSKRPVKTPSQNFGRMRGREVEFQTNKGAQIAKISRKHDSRFDNDAMTSDSSAEEDIKEASAAPMPDAGIIYSFDAPRGPGRGSQILGMALAKAVEKFETRETEKLVKEEYEVVGRESDMGHDGYIADEDDYELI